MLTEFLNQISPEQYPIVWLIMSCIIGYIFCIICFPSILFVSEDKSLMAEPEERSSHDKLTPTLGGVAIYISLILVITFIGVFLNTKIFLLVTGAITILFFTGLKDDLANISPSAKVIAQLASIMLIVVFSDTRIVSFGGIFGVETLEYFTSIAFTVFVFLLLINSINLIDGIDGLAGGVASISCLVFALFFYDSGQISLATLAVALFGSLVAFLRYNFSVNKKLFMGDTGSMVIGFMLAFFAISYINYEQTTDSVLFFNSAPILAFAVVFYPIADTTRIFFLRIFKYKRNPFIADKNHIHHHYANLGYSHKKCTLYIVSTNLVIIIIALVLKNIDMNIQLAALIVYGSLLFYSIFAVRKIKYNIAKKSLKQKSIMDDQRSPLKNKKPSPIADIHLERETVSRDKAKQK